MLINKLTADEINVLIRFKSSRSQPYEVLLKTINAQIEEAKEGLVYAEGGDIQIEQGKVRALIQLKDCLDSPESFSTTED